VYDIETVGNRAHVARYNKLYTADLSDPESLTELDLVAGVPGGSQLILQGDREFVVAPATSTTTIVSPPTGADPVELSSFNHNSSAFLSIGDVSYGRKGAALAIFDTSDTDAVTHLTTIALDVSINQFATRGDYLYASYLFDVSYAPRESGIIVLDISDPVHPQEVYRLIAGTDIAFHDMEVFGDFIYVVFSDNQGTYHDATLSGTDISGLGIYSLENDPEVPTLAGTYVGEDVFTTSGDPLGWNWTKRFELAEVRGHLVVLSSGFSANGTGNSNVYEGRIALLNVADPSAITKVKNILPDAGDTIGTGYNIGADFPRRIEFWKGKYLFVMGSQGLSLYKM